MDAIVNNPYRIAGIFAGATEREIQKQKTKLSAYAKVGKQINSDLDFNILPNIDITEDSIESAFSKIEQKQDKVNYSIFWFLNASSYDNIALEYLKKGNNEKAIGIWEKLTNDKEVDSKNFSAFNNLSTYKLLSSVITDIKSGVELKMKLINSTYFKNFVHYVADETFIIDNQKQSEIFIDEFLNDFKNIFSHTDILKIFNNTDANSKKYLSNKFVEEPIDNIENQIGSCKKKRNTEKISAYKLGVNLYNNTKDDLSLLKLLLGKNELKYKSIANQLANELLQCGIDYFNENHENEEKYNGNLGRDVMLIFNKAKIIAADKLIIDRISDNISNLQSWIDKSEIRLKEKKTQPYIDKIKFELNYVSNLELRDKKFNELGLPLPTRWEIDREGNYIQTTRPGVIGIKSGLKSCLKELDKIKYELGGDERKIVLPIEELILSTFFNAFLKELNYISKNNFHGDSLTFEDTLIDIIVLLDTLRSKERVNIWYLENRDKILLSYNISEYDLKKHIKKEKQKEEQKNKAKQSVTNNDISVKTYNLWYKIIIIVALSFGGHFLLGWLGVILFNVTYFLFSWLGVIALLILLVLIRL